MRRFRISLAFACGLVCLHLYQHRVSDWLDRSGQVSLAGYVILGLMAAVVLILVFKTSGRGLDMETAAAVCLGLVVLFFLIARPRILLKLKVLEFFIFGAILAFENRRIRSYLPLLLVPVAAVLAELAVHLALGRGLYILEMWLSGMFAMTGYVYGAIWRRL